jgi:hypothetical protein
VSGIVRKATPWGFVRLRERAVCMSLTVMVVPAFVRPTGGE